MQSICCLYKRATFARPRQQKDASLHVSSTRRPKRRHRRRERFHTPQVSGTDINAADDVDAKRDSHAQHLRAPSPAAILAARLVDGRPPSLRPRFQVAVPPAVVATARDAPHDAISSRKRAQIDGSRRRRLRTAMFRVVADRRQPRPQRRIVQAPRSSDFRAMNRLHDERDLAARPQPSRRKHVWHNARARADGCISTFLLLIALLPLAAGSQPWPHQGEIDKKSTLFPSRATCRSAEKNLLLVAYGRRDARQSLLQLHVAALQRAFSRRRAFAVSANGDWRWRQNRAKYSAFSTSRKTSRLNAKVRWIRSASASFRVGRSASRSRKSLQSWVRRSQARRVPIIFRHRFLGRRTGRKLTMRGCATSLSRYGFHNATVGAKISSQSSRAAAFRLPSSIR